MGTSTLFFFLLHCIISLPIIVSLCSTQLGEKLGLTKQSIINYEKGLTFPTGKRLNDLITALDVTPEQLLTAEFIQLPEEKKFTSAML